MTEPTDRDEYDAMAAELLPCMFTNCTQGKWHHESCPVYYRSAVAARFRTLAAQKREEGMKSAFTMVKWSVAEVLMPLPEAEMSTKDWNRAQTELLRRIRARAEEELIATPSAASPPAADSTTDPSQT